MKYLLLALILTGPGAMAAQNFLCGTEPDNFVMTTAEDSIQILVSQNKDINDLIKVSGQRGISRSTFTCVAELCSTAVFDEVAGRLLVQATDTAGTITFNKWFSCKDLD